ncbi:MurR/RpiR family transcriptional regulator [Halocella sp. SP3-1]|uniref:MurR/RpiR family transcriptional regulator n=1 Tax=Halocella sp. SP3-1 TaxID=2382161 RepID=UPI000F750C6E|nr:MurR/RpiR family transcriptional regulator [Halocella sp. SP3-1]AZO93803.1 MurR/RpiR family transcriptional regulator [Halocella sp. SP3-1]
MKVILKTKAILTDLTRAEKKVAEYILENQTKIADLSVQELATEAATSPASVVRFCKKINFSGYQDFKIALIKDLRDPTNQQKIKVYDDISVGDSVEVIMKKLSHDNIKVIKDTIYLLDIKAIKKAVKAIEQAERICIFGIGASGLVARDLQYKLMRVKKTVIYYADTHAQLASAANIEKGDLAVAISYSGETTEIYKALKTAKKSEATCISITKYGENSLKKISDIALQVAGSEKNLRLGAITSRIAQLTAVDILFVAYAKNNFSSISDYLKTTRESVVEFKMD